MPQTLTPEIINAALEGFEAQKRRLDEQIVALRSMLGGAAARTDSPTKRQGRRMSAEGRARIAEAQRKRWAASRGETGPATPPRSKPKRKLSAEGRAAIVAALKKRWAAKKAGSTTGKAPAKKTAPGRKQSAAKKPVTRSAGANAGRTARVKKSAAKAAASAPSATSAQTTE